ncbi:MAG TPA: hypothetical protein DCE41_03900, partial [Cytophagales bacterium]|nr:hypothetical protein [Cytophagales bacterium]
MGDGFLPPQKYFSEKHNHSLMLPLVDISMIDQGHDIPLSEVLFYQMEQVMRQAALATKQVFKEHDIPLTKDQWLLLKQLNENAELSQRELAEKTFKEPAAITRMLV